MIGGFALLAWPAEYGVTGVQTFIVSWDGVVYQKDLGTETPALAPRHRALRPRRDLEAHQRRRMVKIR